MSTTTPTERVVYFAWVLFVKDACEQTIGLAPLTALLDLHLKRFGSLSTELFAFWMYFRVEHPL